MAALPARAASTGSGVEGRDLAVLQDAIDVANRNPQEFQPIGLPLLQYDRQFLARDIPRAQKMLAHEQDRDGRPLQGLTDCIIPAETRFDLVVGPRSIPEGVSILRLKIALCHPLSSCA
jgi:hypothetical protein